MIELTKKILIPIFSLVFLVLGVTGLVGLFSYNPLDPAWSVSHSVQVQTTNYAGVLGAYLADIALKSIGYAGYYAAFACFVWGLKLARFTFKPIASEEIPWFKTPYAKIVFFIFSLIFLSGTFAVIDEYVHKPHVGENSVYGGYLGFFLKTNLTPAIGFWVFAGLFTLFGVIASLVAIGISTETWKKIILQTSTAILRSITFIYFRTKYFMVWIFALFGKELEQEEQPELQLETEKLKKPRKIVAQEKKPATPATSSQASFDMDMSGDWQLPPLSLLSLPDDSKAKRPSEGSLSANAEMLEKVLDDFSVKGKIIEVQPGPVVTLYSFEPAPGTKSSRVIGLSDDVARSMTAASARISVIPGVNAIGVELPNSYREKVYLKELLLDNEFKKTKAALPLVLGKDISGKPVVIDLARTPHLLVAGTTGSGKSVGINSMILSLLYKYSPEECKFIMIDPKMLELSVYQDIPHLITPVVTESPKAIVALKWIVKEMENRYRLMANFSVRNLDGYNEKIMEAKRQGKILTRTVQTGYEADTGRPRMEEVELEMKKLPFIVVIVDEMADLMLVAGKEIEGSIQRLAQMARAAGIHIILATQRPSVDVITGVIKANFPSRISFQVTSKIDSRTILGEQGAEQLLGMGDMLYMASASKIIRVHGPFVSDDEVQQVADYLRKQGKPNYIEEVTIGEDDDSGLPFGDPGDETNDLYRQSVAVVLRDQKVSTSYLQRVFKIGYNRAANLIDQMEKEGVISAPDHVGRRKILMGK